MEGTNTPTTDGPSIFRRVLRDEFDRLAPELQAFHGVRGHMRFRGECRIEAGGGAVVRMLRWLLRLPGAAATTVLEFELTAGAEREIWVRRFPGRVMKSALQAVDGQLVERIGPVDCWFSLASGGGALTMELSRVTVFGVALPRAWAPRVWGREEGRGGELYFDAGVRVPGAGLLTAYRGCLRVAPAQPFLQ